MDAPARASIVDRSTRRLPPLAPIGGQRFIPSGRAVVRESVGVGCFDDRGDEVAGDRFEARAIDLLHIVARPVVVVVQAGVEHDDRNLAFEERPVVAVGGELPGEIEPQRIVDRAAQQPSQAVAGARAERLQPAVAEPADHVDGDVRA